MPRKSVLLSAVIASQLAGCSEPQAEYRAEYRRRIGHLDATRAFFYPHFAVDGEPHLAKLGGASISAATYERYLAGRHGTHYLEDLAFDIALARECQKRRIARNATLLARSTAARRFLDSGRPADSDPDGTSQRKFINEELRRIRVDALCGALRQEDDELLREMFERRYGVGGERVRVRQILVSFSRTRRRLEQDGEHADTATIRAAARRRVADLRARITAGAPFASLLHESDDRTTRSLLRDPKRAAAAGFLEAYNYQRFGGRFAAAVRALHVGGVSPPVESSVGYHIVELVDRQVTRLADVTAHVRRELARGRAKPTEVAALRRRLLAQYGYAPDLRHD